MDKRGELTSGQIIVIVLIIVGLIVLLLFLPSISKIYSSGGEVDRELCHLSAIARATAPTIAESLVPLRCEAERICISESGRNDECKQFAGEKNVRGVKLGGSDSDRARTIMKESADAMFFCWSMLGEGQIDLWGKITTFGITKPKCVVCSRIAIDEELWMQESFQRGVMDRVDINKFLAENRPSENVGRTYLQFFTDVGVKAPPAEISTENAGEPEDQMAIVFGQIKTTEGWAEAGLKTAGTGLVLYGSSFLTPVGAITKTPVGAFLSGAAIFTSSAVSAYQTHQGQVLSAAYCGEFTSSNQDAKQGCSVVRVLEWDASAINSFCHGGIEGRV